MASLEERNRQGSRKPLDVERHDLPNEHQKRSVRANQKLVCSTFFKIDIEIVFGCVNKARGFCEFQSTSS